MRANVNWFSVLAHHARRTPDRPITVFEGQATTYAEMAAQSAALAGGFAKAGVGRGDVVAILAYNCPEFLEAVFAANYLGAIAMPINWRLAAPEVRYILEHAGAKVLVCGEELVGLADEATKAMTAPPAGVCITAAAPEGWRSLADLRAADPPLPAEVGPDDVHRLMYTSGTTGRPKGAVHTHDGFPIKGTQDMAHCFDVQPGDTLFWFTDIGWMMGPWAIIGALTLGATLFIYDGTPDYPAPDRVWDMVERHRVTILGISPTAVRGLMRYGEEWVRKHDLSSLRELGSTGEPWNPAPWFWYFREVGGGRIPIINYSGGTEVSGGIVCGNPLTPLKPCSFAGPVPGMAADVVDDQGRSVRGEVGELVIRQPWPGMTRGFWRDPQRYLDTYWSRWPGVWVHGDWARIDEDGFWYIEGRSDDTIKVAGKRVGPAEVESAAVSHPAVSEAAAIGVPHELKGEAVVVFVVLKPGHQPSDALAAEIQEAVVRHLGRALRPDAIRFVADLPRTRNAKVLRRLVRAVYLGKEDLGDLSSLENPAALDEVRRARP